MQKRGLIGGFLGAHKSQERVGDLVTMRTLCCLFSVSQLVLILLDFGWALCVRQGHRLLSYMHRLPALRLEKPRDEVLWLAWPGHLTVMWPGG